MRISSAMAGLARPEPVAAPARPPPASRISTAGSAPRALPSWYRWKPSPFFRPSRASSIIRSNTPEGRIRSPNAAAISRPACRATSKPISSSRRRGPMGMPKASSAPSIASTECPSSSRKPASFRYGARRRFTRKPGRSATSTGVLPRARTRPNPVARASGVVRGPATTSTSGILCTGLKKWRPSTAPGSLHGAGHLVHRQRRGIGGEHRSCRSSPQLPAAPAASRPSARRPPRSPGRRLPTSIVVQRARR